MTVSLRERIAIDCQHGGAWHIMKTRLVSEALMPEFLAEEFISDFRRYLCAKNSEKALIIFDDWLKYKDVSKARLLMAMI
ncbi:hypothetical protein [Litoribrevibacter albus]|uniref:Transposase n=1 Tax=Litoribrevibacter albus TaxID=1473156 RepID=A0AA37W987_9GAMM|nr:hypothetical protein [Litoribrevibacter albus]GLQ32999.1 hypothetical protein GCM10007876_34780 [Litoribrevibacter albus]